MPETNDLAALEKRAQALIAMFEHTVIEDWPEYRDQVNRALRTLDTELVKLHRTVEREAASRPVQQEKLDNWRWRQERLLVGLGVAMGLLLAVRLVDMVRGKT